MCAPPKMAAVMVAAVPQMRSEGGAIGDSPVFLLEEPDTGKSDCASVAPMNVFRDVPTRSGKIEDPDLLSPGKDNLNQTLDFLWQSAHLTGDPLPLAFSALWQSMQVPAVAVGL